MKVGIVLISHCGDNWGMGGALKAFLNQLSFQSLIHFHHLQCGHVDCVKSAGGPSIIVCGLQAEAHTHNDNDTHKGKCVQRYTSQIAGIHIWKIHAPDGCECTLLTHTHTHTMMSPWFYPNDGGEGERELMHNRQRKESTRDREECWLFSLSILSLADGNSIMQ